MKSHDIDGNNQEIARRIEERKEIEIHHARESRRIFWKNLPRNILLIAAALFAIWTVKSCESRNSRYDEDRTGIKGMPY